MTTEEKQEYLSTELNHCSNSQKERAKTQMNQADKYRMFPTDMVFKKWVTDIKAKLEGEATPEELADVVKHLRV